MQEVVVLLGLVLKFGGLQLEGLFNIGFDKGVENSEVLVEFSAGKEMFGWSNMTSAHLSSGK
jgi:hypothetical protein